MKKKLLLINSSGRLEGSITRSMTQNISSKIKSMHNELSVIDRDLVNGMPFVDESWINANFTAPELRHDQHLEELKYSDLLVDEIKQANILVIGSPIYNFAIPAVLKAWIDQIARARLTFKYTDQGPVGLMKNKKAVLVMASGGVAIGSELDFASPHLKQVMRFIGINDLMVVDSNNTNDQSLTTQLEQFIDNTLFEHNYSGIAHA